MKHTKKIAKTTEGFIKVVTTLSPEIVEALDEDRRGLCSRGTFLRMFLTDHYENKHKKVANA